MSNHDVYKTRMPIAGVEFPSLSDWPGKMAMVFFFQGCPFSCGTCFNPELQRPYKQPSGIDNNNQIATLGQIISSIDDMVAYFPNTAMVCSGGECLLHQTELELLLSNVPDTVKDRAIETTAMYPNVLQSLLDKQLINHVFFDIKTVLDDAIYCDILNVSSTSGKFASPVSLLRKSIDIILSSDVDYTIRTTCFKDYPTEEQLGGISDSIRDVGMDPMKWVKQKGIE